MDSSSAPNDFSPERSNSSSSGGGGGGHNFPASSLHESARSTVCAICKASTESYHLNYGANSCLSCRAFFRRTIQSGREPKFVCKTGSPCKVTIKTRRRCKRCRFDLCLQAGMRPEYVLDGDQIKVRFRRMIRKKRRQARKETKAGTTSSGARKIKSEPDETMVACVETGELGGAATLDNVEYQEAPLENSILCRESRSGTREISRAISKKTPKAKREAAVEDLMPFSTEKVAQKRSSRKAKAREEILGKEISLSDTHSELDNTMLQRILAVKEEATTLSSPVCKLERGQVFAPTNFCAKSEMVSSGSQYLETGVVTQLDKGESSSRSSSALPALKLEEDDLENILFPTENIFGDNINYYTNQTLLPAVSSFLTSPAALQDNIFSMSNFPIVNVQPESVFEAYVKRTRQNWTMAFQFFIPSEKFLMGLAGIHNRSGSILTKALLKIHMTSVADLFKRFAMMQPEFRCLSSTDQHTLLTRNTPIFVQYVLGRYFHAQSNEEQLLWLLLGHPVAELVIQNPNLPSVSMMEFNSYLKLYQDLQAMQLYLGYARRLNKPHLQFHSNCVIALMCLFTSNYATILEDPNTVRRNLQFVFSVADGTCDKFNSVSHLDLSSIVEVLEAMTNSFEANVAWEESLQEPAASNSMALEVMPGYSPGEEAWITMQLRKIEDSHNAVPFGEDIIHENIMYNFDVPLSKPFFQTSYRIYAERIRYVLKNNEKYNCLSDQDQTRLWTSSVYTAMALQVCKLESVKSGFEQISAVYGRDDMAFITSLLGTTMNKNKLKKVSMRDQAFLHMMDPVSFNRYVAISDSLADLVQDNEVYKLLMLFTIFSNNEIFRQGERTPFTAISKQYMNITRRRLMHFEGGQEEKIFGRFKETLGEIGELSTILQQLSL